MAGTEVRDPTLSEVAGEKTAIVEASDCGSIETNDQAEIESPKEQELLKSKDALNAMDAMNQTGESQCDGETEAPAQTKNAVDKTEKKGITIVQGPPEDPEVVKEREALKQAELLVEASKLAGLIGKGTFEDLLNKGERGEKAIEAIKKAFQESFDPKALAVALGRMLKLEGSPYSVAYEAPSRPGGEAVLALEKSLGKDRWGLESKERSKIEIPAPATNVWDHIRPPIRFYEDATN